MSEEIIPLWMDFVAVKVTLSHLSLLLWIADGFTCQEFIGMLGDQGCVCGHSQGTQLEEIGI